LRDLIVNIKHPKRYVHLCYKESRLFAIKLKDIICICNKGRVNVQGSTSYTYADFTSKVRSRLEGGSNPLIVGIGAQRPAITLRIYTTRAHKLSARTFHSKETSARWPEENACHPKRSETPNKVNAHFLTYIYVLYRYVYIYT